MEDQPPPRRSARIQEKELKEAETRASSFKTPPTPVVLRASVAATNRKSATTPRPRKTASSPDPKTPLPHAPTKSTRSSSTTNTTPSRRPSVSPSPLKKGVKMNVTPTIKEGLHEGMVMAWLNRVLTQLNELRPTDVLREHQQYGVSGTEEHRTNKGVSMSHVDLVDDTEASKVRVNVELYKKLFEYAQFCREHMITDGLHLCYSIADVMLQLRIKRVYTTLLRTYLYPLVDVLNYNPEHGHNKTHHRKVMTHMIPVHCVPVSKPLQQQMEHVLHVTYVHDCIMQKCCLSDDVVYSGLACYILSEKAKLRDLLLQEKILPKVVATGFNNGPTDLTPRQVYKYFQECINLLMEDLDRASATTLKTQFADEHMMGFLLKGLGNPDTRSTAVATLLDVSRNVELRPLMYYVLENHAGQVCEMIASSMVAEPSPAVHAVFRDLLHSILVTTSRTIPESVFRAFFTNFGTLLQSGANHRVTFDVLSDMTNKVDSASCSDLVNVNHKSIMWLANELRKDDVIAIRMHTVVLAALQHILAILDPSQVDPSEFLKGQVKLHVLPHIITHVTSGKRIPLMLLTAMKNVQKTFLGRVSTHTVFE